MATVNWSSLGNGNVVAFDPAVDFLVFDDGAISAASVILGVGVSSITFSYGGKTVTLSTAPGTTGDNNANSLTGTSFGDHQLYLNVLHRAGDPGGLRSGPASCSRGR